MAEENRRIKHSSFGAETAEKIRRPKYSSFRGETFPSTTEKIGKPKYSSFSAETLFVLGRLNPVSTVTVHLTGKHCLYTTDEIRGLKYISFRGET